MSELNNTNPAPAAGPSAPAAGPAPASAPASNPNSDPSGQTKDNKTVSIPVEELNAFKRKAGRWDKHESDMKKGQRSNRRSPSDVSLDNADPEILETIRVRDEKIDQQNSELLRYKVREKVQDLLDNDEYKSVPDAVRKAVLKNPLGFINADSEELEHMVDDIQTYFDDILDNLAPSNQPKTPSGAPKTEIQTPPASPSGPSSPGASPLDGTEGKTGQARSTTVLRNLLKRR